MAKKSRFQKIAKTKITLGENIVMESVTSTNVKAVGYNEAAATMQIDFKTGGRYQYFLVPKKIYMSILHGEHTAKDGHYPSVGAALDWFVKKGGYAYKRI